MFVSREGFFPGKFDLLKEICVNETRLYSPFLINGRHNKVTEFLFSDVELLA